MKHVQTYVYPIIYIIYFNIICSVKDIQILDLNC